MKRNNRSGKVTLDQASSRLMVQIGHVQLILIGLVGLGLFKYPMTYQTKKETKNCSGTTTAKCFRLFE